MGILAKDTSRFILDIPAIVALNDISCLPIISDPSHASFWSKWVPPLAYASVSSGCGGMILESHPRPSKSMVDPLQPLNFSETKKVISKVKSLAKFHGKTVI